MPLGNNIRYRHKTMKAGKKIRLAFRGKTVVETKSKGSKPKLTSAGKKLMRSL